MSLAGAQVLVETARTVGLSAALGEQLSRWRKPTAVHDPGKVVLDLAVMLAVGGDCPADVTLLRAGSGLFGPVASTATISRLVASLADSGAEGLSALRSARAAARAQVASLTAPQAEGGEVVVDIDATLITAHSEKEDAAPTYKRGFGFHPLLAYLDHGPGGTGEALAGINRRGNANAGTAADHLAILDLIENQLTPAQREALVIRTDTAACSHAFLDELTTRELGYSVGFYARADVAAAIEALPAQAWVPAVDAEEKVRDGAWVAELSHLLHLDSWPPGMRVIARKERPHPGAQLRLTDIDGHRITCFATNHPGPDLPALELRHRRRARVEDRIRAAKDTGLRNLPYKDAASNQVWIELVLLAQDLTAWTQTLALHGEHAVAEPKRLRLLLFGVAARLIRTGRRIILDLDKSWPHAPAIVHAITTLRAYPTPG